MIQVQTGSRLHFGLLSLPVAAAWPNHAGAQVLPARRFGGVGLMVRDPGVRLTARPSPSWSATGPLAERVLDFAQRFAATMPEQGASPQHICVEAAGPEHAGLGTGTQLGLAVGRALAAAWNTEPIDTAEIARRVGRGQRSGVGLHGFAHGGLVVEAGQAHPGTIPPLVARLDFPEDWRLVLVVPAGTGLHGSAERAAFETLCRTGIPLSISDTLSRLVLLGLLPALIERDLKTFGEALFDFNARVGELFAGAQGGTYGSPRLAEIVTFIRQQGVTGVGQSSWGPTLFAVVGDEGKGRWLEEQLRSGLGLAARQVLITQACNHPAVVECLHGKR